MKSALLTVINHLWEKTVAQLGTPSSYFGYWVGM